MAKSAKKAVGNGNVEVNENETENQPVANNETEKLRKSKAQVWYVNPEGESNSPREGVNAIRFKFANGIVRDIDGNFGEHVKNCAFWQGLAIRIQRSYQNEKDIDTVIASVDETLEDLRNDVWIETAAGEPRVTMLANAVKYALENAGETVDETRFKSIIDKLADKEYAKRAKSNAMVVAHLAQMKVESAQRRAAEAMQAATDNQGVSELM